MRDEALEALGHWRASHGPRKQVGLGFPILGTAPAVLTKTGLTITAVRGCAEPRGFKFLGELVSSRR